MTDSAPVKHSPRAPTLFLAPAHARARCGPLENDDDPRMHIQGENKSIGVALIIDH